MLTVPFPQDTLAVGSELQGLKVKRLHVGGLPHGAEEDPCPLQRLQGSPMFRPEVGNGTWLP